VIALSRYSQGAAVESANDARRFIAVGSDGTSRAIARIQTSMSDVEIYHRKWNLVEFSLKRLNPCLAARNVA